MAKKRTTKTEKLLKEIDRRGRMSHKQMVKFLLRGTGNEYNETTRKYYDGTLYGTSTRSGLLYVNCFSNYDGTWSRSFS